MKYEHCKKCRHELGLVGGNDVSQIRGSLVDLENDLRGQTRYSTRCPTKHYQWKDFTGISGEKTVQPSALNIPGEFCRRNLQIQTPMKHLKACQMIKYSPVALPPPFKINPCLRPAQQMQNGISGYS
jgi:hypothetical protein